MTLADALYAVERLHSWADNETSPTTFAKFCSLIGSSQYRQVWATPLGYLEADLLAKALDAWATYPNEINAAIHAHD